MPDPTNTTRPTIHRLVAALLVAAVTAAGGGEVFGKQGGKKKEKQGDPYAEYVWPPPPDEARIRLASVISGRADVEARGRFRRRLLGISSTSPYDSLQKPFAVDFDGEGRIVVSDTALAALVRFDRNGKRMDVFGTRGRTKLRTPLGLDVLEDGAILVADGGLRRVVAFDSEGAVTGVYGSSDSLVNPTDVALSPDGARLYVADSKAHAIRVLDRTTGEAVSQFGSRGAGEGEFSFPTSLAFGPDGSLFVVDQMNARVQMLAPDGEFLGAFGGRGVGFGNFVRPKDVAVDAAGRIYVTDYAFNNVQIFDTEFRLLTFVGEGGRTPGQFLGASGVAIRGAELAVVDQLGRRLQVFGLIEGKER